MAGWSDAQETAINEYCHGISGTPPPVGSHLVMCTADPEDGTTGVSGATAVAATFATNATQQSNRRRVQNSAQVVLTNDSGASLDVTHIATRVGAAGAIVSIMALPATLTVPDGATLTYEAGELTFDVG